MLLGHHGKRLGNRDVEFGNSCGHMFRTDGFVEGVEKGVSPTQATVLHDGRSADESIAVDQRAEAELRHSLQIDGRKGGQLQLRQFWG